MSPRGLKKIREVAEAAAARQKAFDEAGPGVRFFSIDDGETAKVRFLEGGEDVWMVWTHQLPAQPGQQFGDSVMCLDQEDQGNPCAACARGLGRGARVTINLIWYGAPKFAREPGKDGKPGKIKKDVAGNAIVEGAEDTVAVWNCSQTVGGRLDHLNEKNSDHGGLTGIICEVKRQGTRKNTSYMIDLDKVEQPNAHDVELYKSKGDPRQVIRSLTFGDMERVYSGSAAASQLQSTGVPQVGVQPAAGMENNAFAQAGSGGINKSAFGA